MKNYLITSDFSTAQLTGLIESALKHKTENDSTFKGDHHFVNTVLLPLIASKRNELTEVVMQ